jgi:alkylation response protein AidB-like acyl-CoA dehydrogenase
MFSFTVEQIMIQEMVRKLTKEKILPRVPEIDENDEYPEDIVRILAENALLKLALPEKYGGIDSDTTTLSLVITELSQASPPMGSLVLSTQSVIKIINRYGSDEQRARIFSELSTGDKLLAFCLTEPNAGSDAHSIQTNAVLHGNNYIVNGTKCFITLAGVSEYYLVFVRTGEKRPNDISALLVPKNAPGLSIGEKDNKISMRGSVTAELNFDDAEIPTDNLIGIEGGGWEMLANYSNSMRCWGAASIALGIAQAALEYAVKYAKKRVQFGKPLLQFQAIQFMLVDMEINVEAARSLIYRTNFQVDEEGENITPKTMALVSMAKCFASDVAMKVTTDAVQILGGYGIMKDYPVQRMMRDAKAVQIFDGTNQVQRMVIGKSLSKRY